MILNSDQSYDCISLTVINDTTAHGDRTAVLGVKSLRTDITISDDIFTTITFLDEQGMSKRCIDEQCVKQLNLLRDNSITIVFIYSCSCLSMNIPLHVPFMACYVATCFICSSNMWRYFVSKWRRVR